MEQCPGLVAETRERRLICPEVCPIKDDRCCPFVQLHLSRSNPRLVAEQPEKLIIINVYMHLPPVQGRRFMKGVLGG